MTDLKKPLSFSFIFVLIMGLSVSATHAQVQDQMNQMEVYKLIGKVVDANTREALPDVRIEVTDPDMQSAMRSTQTEAGGLTGGSTTETTNDQGEFSFTELPPGEYTIRIDYEAYEKWERNVNLNQDSQLTIELQPMK